jgi:hypothetical protein
MMRRPPASRSPDGAGSYTSPEEEAPSGDMQTHDDAFAAIAPIASDSWTLTHMRIWFAWIADQDTHLRRGVLTEGPTDRDRSYASQ